LAIAKTHGAITKTRGANAIGARVDAKTPRSERDRSSGPRDDPRSERDRSSCPLEDSRREPADTVTEGDDSSSKSTCTAGPGDPRWGRAVYRTSERVGSGGESTRTRRARDHCVRERGAPRAGPTRRAYERVRSAPKAARRSARRARPAGPCAAPAGGRDRSASEPRISRTRAPRMTLP